LQILLNPLKFARFVSLRSTLDNTEERPVGTVSPILATDFDDIVVRGRQRHEWLVRLMVFMAASLLFFIGAGSFGLWDCWETHYGETARYMFENHDTLSPWWGYKDKIGGESPTGEWFFSKPVLIMYGDIIGMHLVGFGDWAIRISWAFLGALVVLISYISISLIFNRKTGLMAAGMLMTAPMFFFLSRQAITDLPYAGTMTIGMLFMCAALYSPRLESSNRGLFVRLAAVLALFLTTALPQFVNVALDLFPEGNVARFSGIARVGFLIQKSGWLHAILYGLATIALLVAVFVPLYRQYRAKTLFTPEGRDRWIRRFMLWTAYMFFGYATLGKGLLGFCLPGAIMVLYLLLTGEWRLLKRLDLGRGLSFFALVMLPWYVGMFCRHGMGFYNRFLVHDHFNRLGAGVHQLDTGTFEHFMRWLSIGTFPWIAFIPLVLFGLSKLRMKDASSGSRMRLMLYVWAFFAYILFTLSATKYHHYIFPAVFPTILITALVVKDFLEDRSWIARFGAIAGLAIMLSVGLFIRSDMQVFRQMFTYKYDRPLPTHLPNDPDAAVNEGTDLKWKDSTFYQHTSPALQKIIQAKPLQYKTFLTAWLVVASVCFVVMIFAGRFRKGGLAALWGISLVLAWWGLNFYMPLLSPSWSQKYIFEDYFQRCELLPNAPEVEDTYTPLLKKAGLGFIPDSLGYNTKRVCREDVVAWLITWRGETYFTHSEIKPLMKATQLKPYLEELNHGYRFFALTQPNRASSLKSSLDKETKALREKGATGFENIRSWKVETVHWESDYFSLVMATPITDDSTEPDVPEPTPVAPPEESETAGLGM